MRAARRSPITTPGPTTAVEIAARRVSIVTLDGAGSPPVVSAHATEWLPPGAVVPALNAQNVPNADAVAAALARAIERVGARPRRIGLVIPDGAARVSIVRFDKVPARARDLDELVRWQVRKGAPFPIDDAQVSYVAGAATDAGGREFVVAVARRDVVGEYEAISAGAGMHAGIVDLASFNLVNAALAAGLGSGDWLLVHITPDDTTIAVVRGGEVIFFRNRPAAEGTLEDLVHQTAMYYEDRLGGRALGRVVLSGGADRAEEVRRSLEARLGVRVESLDPRAAAALRDRISAGADLLDAIAAPIGLLLRDLVRLKPDITTVGGGVRL